MSVRLDDLWNTVVCFQATVKFAYRKVLDTCDANLSVPHTLRSELESRQDSRILEIDFGATFHMVGYQDSL